MTKTELVKRLAEKTGLSQNEAAAVVEALFAVDGGIIAERVARGLPVEIGDFGSFVPAIRSGRGREGHVGDHEGAPPAAPAFHPGSGWREAAPRVRGRKKPPRGTGSTGPRRGDSGGGSTRGAGGTR